MGYASRAPRNEKNTGIKPKTESVKKRSKRASGYNAAETNSWNPETKRTIHNGDYCLIRKQDKVEDSQGPIRQKFT